MAQNEERLRRTQAGIEAVRGTRDVVTRRLRERVRLLDTREPLEFAEDDGTFDAWQTFAQGPVTVAGTAEGPASFEDWPWWLLLGFDGDPTLTSDAGTPAARTRLYTPNPEEDDLASATMEHGVPDNAYVSDMVMVPEWTVRGDIDGDASWMFSSRLIARNLEPLPGGFTPAVPVTNRDLIKAAGTKITIDDSAAALGTTPLLGKGISFALTCNSAITPKRFLEDENQMSARVGRGARQITGQIRIEFDTDDEREHYRNGEPRAIRIEREGPIIHGAVRKRARIDIPRAYWLAPSDDPRESNMTLTFGFRAYKDAAIGYPARIEVINALATL